MKSRFNKKKREQIYRSLRRVMKNRDEVTITKELDRFNSELQIEDPLRRREYIRDLVTFYVDGTGFCGTLLRIHRCSPNDLPELLSKKPTFLYDGPWWWKQGNYEVRIKVLDQILKNFKH